MKKLPLNLQTDINGYLIYTFPYSILNTFAEYKDYLIENYLQCFGFINDSNCITFEYADGVGYNNMFYDSGPLDITFNSYKVGLQLDIKQYIISAIDNNNYVVIFIDEYYLKSRPAYQKFHCLHEIMIWGYDAKKFYYSAFDRKLLISAFPQNQIDDAYRFGYDMNIPAATNWINGKSIILIKPKLIQNPYTFSVKRFIENLKMYLTGDFSASYNSFVISTEKCYIGLYNTNLIRYCVDNPSETIYTLYPAIHAWYESKRNLLGKIRYCYEKINYENNKLILDYESNVKTQSDAIRLSFLKYTESGKLNRDTISLLLNNLFISESNIVNAIHDELSGFVR